MPEKKDLLKKAKETLDQFPRVRIEESNDISADSVYGRAKDQALKSQVDPSNEDLIEKNKKENICRHIEIAGWFDTILHNFSSPAERLKHFFEEKNVGQPSEDGASSLVTYSGAGEQLSYVKTLYVGYVPTDLLQEPPEQFNPIEYDYYYSWRPLFSLLRICERVDPKLFFCSKKFLKDFLGNPSEKRSLFLQSLKIEPCFVQS